MRRLLSTSLGIFSLIVGGVGAPIAYAQLNGGTFGSTPTSANNFGAPALNQPTVVDSIISAQTGNIPANESGANRPLSFGAGFDKVIGTVMNLIMSIFAWLLGVAMIMLDYSVYYTVVKMGDYVQNLSGIGVAWRILRDIGNIALIFGFLAVGITTILNVDWYGGGKKFIPSLVIAAVLLNFSLFMTEAVIDTGNLFATQFYTQINGGVPAGEKLSASVGSSIGNEVISQKIMSVLGLQTIYGEAIKPNSTVFKEGNITFISLMGIGLFIVAAFVMFSLALILITRFVALIFIIILSPIGFAGYAIPQLASTSKKWSDALVEQTITAPILLLLLYIALRVITDVNFLRFGTKGPNYLGFVQNANSGVQVVNGGFDLQGLASAMLSFTVAMGLLLAVTYFSKKLGAMGGDWATKTAGKLSFGATAFGASALLNSTARAGRWGLQRYAPNNKVSRGASRLLRSAESMRMDIRAMPALGSAIQAGLTAGGAGEAANPIEKSAGGRVRQVAEWYKKSGQESDRQSDQETRVPRLKKAIAANDTATVARILGTMSDKELEDNSIQKLMVNPVASAALAQSRFDKLQTSDGLSDAQKNNLRNQRETGLKARYADPTVYTNPPTHPTAPNAQIPSVRNPGTNMSRGEQAVRGLTNEATSQLPDAVLAQPEVYENLSIRQLNSIYNAGRIQDSTATTVGTFLRADPTFMAYFAGRNPQQQADIRAFWHI
jgi:hypothetical protein